MSSPQQEVEESRLPSGRATAETKAPPLPFWGRSPTHRPPSPSFGSAGRWGLLFSLCSFLSRGDGAVISCCWQVDSQLFSEFKAWKEEPTLSRSCCFLERVYKEDIYPCLTFSKSEVCVQNSSWFWRNRARTAWICSTRKVPSKFDVLVLLSWVRPSWRRWSRTRSVWSPWASSRCPWSRRRRWSAADQSEDPDTHTLCL